MDSHEWTIEHAKLPGGLPPSRYAATPWAATSSGLERDGEFVGFPEVGAEILRLAEKVADLETHARLADAEASHQRLRAETLERENRAKCLELAEKAHEIRELAEENARLKASAPGGSPFDRIVADRLADEVASLVARGFLDSRSAAADALLDYSEPQGRSGRIGSPPSNRNATSRIADSSCWDVWKAQGEIVERARIRRELLAWLVEPLGPKDAGLACGRRIVDEINRIAPEK